MENKLFDFINLHKGEEDKQKVLDDVKTNISFRNANLWILICAIFTACIGLNVNSPAVIIGAMLISPLMGPIVGAGFALGTYDFELLKRAGKNLIIATLSSLSVAFIYFTISPFKETQSELLARTSPNIYDVLISIFGGLVGAISLTRINKGNPIPGVAIATALMPPLCTAGYGLAIGNYSFFFGAFYLYTINSFFICISTFAIIKYLKYPPVKNINPKYDKQIHYGITIITLILILPSFYVAYNLYNERKFVQKIDQFITTEFTNQDYVVIYKKTRYNSSPKKIELAFLSKKFTPEEIKILNKKLPDYGIPNTKLIIRQNTKDIKSEILSEISSTNANLTAKDIEIERLRKELDQYQFKNLNLTNEMAVLFPELKNVSIGRQIRYADTDSAKTFTTLLYKTSGNETDLTKLKQWLRLKLNTSNIELVPILEENKKTKNASK